MPDTSRLTERDLCTQYVTPAIAAAGRNPATRIREQVDIARGRVVVQGKKTERAERTFADYILYHKSNIPLAAAPAAGATGQQRLPVYP